MLTLPLRPILGLLWRIHLRARGPSSPSAATASNLALTELARSAAAGTYPYRRCSVNACPPHLTPHALAFAYILPIHTRNLPGVFRGDNEEARRIALVGGSCARHDAVDNLAVGLPLTLTCTEVSRT